MKFLRSIAVLTALIAAGFAGAVVVARFSDGPMGPFPGGPLIAGEFVDEWVQDWTFAEQLLEVELQLYDPDRSRRTWILVHGGSAFIPCAFPHLTFWKRWPHHAMANGRALVRIDGKRYAADLVLIEDLALAVELGGRIVAKYAREIEGDVWYFRLIEPAADRNRPS